MSNTEKRDTDVTLLNVRGSYLKLVKAEAVAAEKGNPNAKKRFGMVVLIPKDDAESKAKLDKAEASVKAANPKTKFLKSNLLLKCGDTDEKAEPEYAGHWFFSANRNEDQGAPDCYGRKRKNGKLSLEETKSLFYSGCRVNVVVGIYKPKQWDKVCASLEIVQFWAHDEKLGNGASASADELPDIEDDEDDADDGLGE